mgnify:CR=1 FL=1
MDRLAVLFPGSLRDCFSGITTDIFPGSFRDGFPGIPTDLFPGSLTGLLVGPWAIM